MAATRVLTLVSLVMSTTTTKSVDTYLSIPTWRRYQELTIAEFGPHTAMILQLQTTEFNHKSRSCLGGYGSLPLDGIFVWDFPTLCQHRRYYIIYCHVVSMRKREDPGNKCLCVAAISLLGCCHLANFDLFSRCD